MFKPIKVPQPNPEAFTVDINSMMNHIIGIDQHYRLTTYDKEGNVISILHTSEKDTIDSNIDGLDPLLYELNLIND